MFFTNRHRLSLTGTLNILGILGLLAGCASTVQPELAGVSQRVGSPCSDGITTISGNFAGAAFARCEVLESGHFRLTITPEDAQVNNCSPWYAFEASTSQSLQVAIDLNYSSCGHRYRPKLRVGGADWQLLPADKLSLDFSKGKTNEGGKPVADAVLRLTLPAGRTQIAAQPLLLPEDNAAWLDQIAKSPAVSRGTLGKSREGRPIEWINLLEPGVVPARQVVLLGRQHPPETTGGIALQAFTERLLEDDQIARTYRSRYSTRVVPLLNPDGVVHGNWRHNMGQTDLNRDWGPFLQPETQRMRDLLANIAASPGQRLRLFLDFHSTHYDTIYTLTEAQITDPAGFTGKWIAATQALITEKKIRVEPGHKGDRPTAKTWVYEKYKVPTATYEIGDTTSYEVIRRHARAAAEAMMSTLAESDQ